MTVQQLASAHAHMCATCVFCVAFVDLVLAVLAAASCFCLACGAEHNGIGPSCIPCTILYTGAMAATAVTTHKVCIIILWHMSVYYLHNYDTLTYLSLASFVTDSIRMCRGLPYLLNHCIIQPCDVRVSAVCLCVAECHYQHYCMGSVIAVNRIIATASAPAVKAAAVSQSEAGECLLRCSGSKP